MLQPFGKCGIKAVFNLKDGRRDDYFRLQLIEKSAYSADATL
jgi:hypothetical protein